MQSRHLLALAATAALTGCALLGFGPKTALVEGTVYLADSGTPVPHAEVCAFGLDTTCVRADENGRYRMRRMEQTISLRFRAGQLPAAASDSLRVVPPGRYQVDCAISGRLVISDRPQPCQPAPAR
jgi:hypothetical protein